MEYKLLAVTGYEKFNIILQGEIDEGWNLHGSHLATPYKGTMQYSILLKKIKKVDSQLEIPYL